MRFRRDDTAPVDVLIRRFGVRDPNDWGADIEAEFRRGNDLWNRLVEIERTAEAAYEAATADDTAMAAAALEALRREQAELRAERKKIRQQKRSRRVPPEMTRALAEVAAKINKAKEARKAAHTEARQKLRDLLDRIDRQREEAITRARRASGVYWATANAIVQSFATARMMMLRRRAQGLPAELHFRRFDGGGRIRNQFTGGGLSLAAFLGGEREVGLRPPTAERGAQLTLTAYSSAVGEPRTITRTRRGKVEQVQWLPPGEPRRLKLPVTAHRPLAPEAITDPGQLRVKYVELVLRRNRDWHRLMPERERWLWRECRAVVTATAPAGTVTINRPADHPLVAVNLGWRNVPEGLRVATVVAEKTDGKAGDAEFVVLPSERVKFAERIAAIEGERDRALDEIRPLVRGLPWPAAPAPIAALSAALAKAPRFGQRALARLIIEWQIEAGSWRPADLARLEDWRQADNRRRSRAEAARRRFYGERRERYRLAAKAIAERAAVILLDEADFAALARLPADRDPELELIMRYRRSIAAPSQLRAEILHQAAKYGRAVMEQPGPSTFVCHRCGMKVDPVDPAELRFWCAGCTRFVDQDVNNCLTRLARWRSSRGAPPGAAVPLG